MAKKAKTKREIASTVSLLDAMSLSECQGVLDLKKEAFVFPCGLTITEKLIHQSIRFKLLEAKGIQLAHREHDIAHADGVKHEWVMTLEVGDEGKDGYRRLESAYASDMGALTATTLSGGEPVTWDSGITADYTASAVTEALERMREELSRTVIPKKRPKFTGLVKRVADRIDQARTALGKFGVEVGLTPEENAAIAAYGLGKFEEWFGNSVTYELSGLEKAKVADSANDES